MNKLLVIVAIATIFAISSADTISESLAAHNNYRTSLSLPALTWSNSLAKNAQTWANYLAKYRKTSHSHHKSTIGENIAYGNSKSSSITEFVDEWASEKTDFVEGENYPACTSTGNVNDVDHYTQIVWEKTTQVGCGVAKRSGKMYYVCQYSPAGNIKGQPVYTVTPVNNTQNSTDPVITDPITTPNTTTPVTTDPVTTPNTTAPVTTNSTTEPSSSQDQFITDSLAAHNNERNAHGVASLTWSASLAQSAQAYAQVMASTGTTSHSTGRVNVGENLAWGSGKSISTSSLAGMWVAEKKYFIAGKNFPDCSTTGSWHDVAHYTQLMWAKTTQLGCGIAKSSSGTNYYVCHYSPQGNMDGESVYTVGSTPITTTPVTTNSTTNTTTPVTTAPVKTNSTSTTNSTTQSGSSQDQFITDSLAAHNNERSAHGVPALTWSTSLAQSAQAYAEVQAQTGTTSHSTGRSNVGENLAWGGGGHSTPAALAGMWVAEKQYFIAGKNFPDCSTTGSWHDVAHYTQLMWAKTTQLGCGLAKSNSGQNYYVCHYSPQGNINGNPVY